MIEAVRQLAEMPDEMPGGEVGKLLGQVDKELLVTVLVNISGYSPAAFRNAFRHVERYELTPLSDAGWISGSCRSQ